MNNNPIIELYEYQIHGYQPEDRHTDSYVSTAYFKFGDINDSSESSCERISIEGSQADKSDDTNKSSCDPIYNLTGGLDKKSIYDIDNIYGNYKLFLAKNTDINDKLNDESIKNLLDNLNKAFNIHKNFIQKNKNKLFDTIIELLEKNVNIDDPLFYEHLNTLNMSADNSAIIQRLNINSTNKIILFGDFHGSFHTFFRTLCRFHRYGIINLETFEIKEPYKIIFLGDILDRGQYSLDILNIIFKLITINNIDTINQKIIFNRGNHENYDQYTHSTYGAYNEFKKKIIKQSDFDNFILLFYKLLCILPSAVIINCENKKKIWCSHGGFPEEWLEINGISPTGLIDSSKNDESITPTGLIDSSKNDEPITDDNILNIYYDDNISRNIRWSDFGGYDSVNKSVNFIPNTRGPSINMYTCIGTKKFLDSNNIDFIIRGHQDSISNSSLFEINGTEYKINNPTNKNIDNFLYFNDTVKSFGNRVHGPIARLVPNKDLLIDNYFPVLTISTNTDAGRNLNSDSFALLRFDIESDEINNFSIKKLSIIYAINNILSNTDINKGDIFLKIIKLLDNIFDLYNNKHNLFLIYLTQNIDKYPNIQMAKDIKENSLKIHTIYNDFYDVYIYYKQKFESLKTKINNMIILGQLPRDEQKTILKEYVSNLEKIFLKLNTTITKISETNKILNLGLIPDANMLDLFQVTLEKFDQNKLLKDITGWTKDY
jgi:hypothetical protein